jgi:hypothetical protein
MAQDLRIHRYNLESLVPYAPDETDEPPCCSYWVDRYTPGIPTADQLMMFHVVIMTVDFAEALPGSRAACVTAPDAETIYSVQLDGVEVGTITFGLGETVGQFAAPAAFQAVPGSLLSVVAPSIPDASQSDVTITIVGECQTVPPTPGGSSRSITVVMSATGIVECRLTNVPRPRVRIAANSRVVGRLTNA